MSEQSPMNAAEVKFQVSSERLRSQAELLRLLTLKSSVVLSAALVVATINIPVAESAFQPDLLCIIYACLSVSAVFSCFAIWPRTDWDGPKLDIVAEHLKTYHIEEAVDWIAQAQIKTYKHNLANLEKRDRDFTRSLVFLIIGVFGFVVYKFTHYAL